MRRLSICVLVVISATAVHEVRRPGFGSTCAASLHRLSASVTTGAAAGHFSLYE